MNKFLLFLLFFLVFALGLRFIFFFSNRPKLYDKEELNFETTLFSEPTLSGKIQKFSVSYKTYKLFITTTILPEFHYGDKINISGPVRKVLSNGTGTHRSELLTMSSPKIVAKNDDKNVVLAIVSSIRQKIISFFSQNLSQDYSGLMLGIVFGIKEKIPQDFLKILRYSGVMHVIAASGMNVTMVGGFLSSIFLLFLRRQVALTFSIIGILFYAVFAGLEASIIRASIMGILVFTAQILGRQSWPGFILLITGFTMLFWDPNLIFDIGFQLSFLATIGLLYLKPVFKNPFLDTFQTTIFAQITTLPVVIANFGVYSLWSVIVNALVLWTVPPIMVIGGVSSLMSFIAEPLARIILFLSLPLLIYFDIVVKFFNNLGGLVNFSLNWLEIIGYYSLVAGLVLIRKR